MNQNGTPDVPVPLIQIAGKDTEKPGANHKHKETVLNGDRLAMLPQFPPLYADRALKL